MSVNKNISNYIVLVLPLLFIDLLNFSSRTLESAQNNLFNSTNLFRVIALSLAGGIIILNFFTKLHNKIKFPPLAIQFLFLYWIIGLISLLNGNWILYSLIKIFEYIIFLLFTLSLYNTPKNNSNQFIYCYEKLIQFLELLILSVLIGLIISPSRALYTGLNEYSAVREAFLPFILNGWIIQITSTSVGYFSAILSYTYFISYFEGNRKPILIIKLIITVSFMILAQTRMAMLGFIFAILIYVMLTLRKNKSKLLLITGIVLFTCNINTIFLLLKRGQSSDMLLTFSGRTEWWSFALNYFEKLPFMQKLCGIGFAGAEKLIANESNSAMYTLDSEFFSVLIGTGFLGVSFIVLSLISTYKLAFYCKKNIKYFYRNERIYFFQILGILLMLTIRMITATTLAVVTYYFIIYIIIIAMFSYLKTNIQKRMEVIK